MEEIKTIILNGNNGHNWTSFCIEYLPIFIQNILKVKAGAVYSLYLREVHVHIFFVKFNGSSVPEK